MTDRFFESPMQTLAFLVVIATGLWLVAVAFLMALRPRYSLRLLERMSVNLSASNWRLNLTEQGLRLLAGAALIVHAAASKLPQVFAIAGWFVVLSSILILLMPIRWHGAYGMWWRQRLTPLCVRALSAIPVIAGTGLIYAAF